MSKESVPARSIGKTRVEARSDNIEDGESPCLLPDRRLLNWLGATTMDLAAIGESICDRPVQEGNERSVCLPHWESCGERRAPVPGAPANGRVET